MVDLVFFNSTSQVSGACPERVRSSLAVLPLPEFLGISKELGHLHASTLGGSEGFQEAFLHHGFQFIRFFLEGALLTTSICKSIKPH